LRVGECCKQAKMSMSIQYFGKVLILFRFSMSEPH
jgi:hypothetical protein